MNGPYEPHSAGWLDRVVDEALRDGRVTLASAPEWRRRLGREPAKAEAEMIFALAASPTVGEENVRRMEAES